jgi:hypothetical protein
LSRRLCQHGVGLGLECRQHAGLLATPAERPAPASRQAAVAEKCIISWAMTSKTRK